LGRDAVDKWNSGAEDAAKRDYQIKKIRIGRGGNEIDEIDGKFVKVGWKMWSSSVE